MKRVWLLFYCNKRLLPCLVGPKLGEKTSRERNRVRKGDGGRGGGGKKRKEGHKFSTTRREAETNNKMTEDQGWRIRSPKTIIYPERKEEKRRRIVVSLYNEEGELLFPRRENLRVSVVLMPDKIIFRKRIKRMKQEEAEEKDNQRSRKKGSKKKRTKTQT